MLKNIFKKIGKFVKHNLALSIIIAVVIIAIIALSIYVFAFKGDIKVFGARNISLKAAGEKVVAYINSDILQGKGTATLTESSETNGLYKLKLTLGDASQTAEAYVTKDGKFLFPIMTGYPIDLDATAGDPGNGNGGTPATASCDSVKKADKPVLEAFVVSQCPYGVQMQRVFAKAIEEAPALKDSLKIRYIGTIEGGKVIAMHGDAEAQENLRQICIRDEQASKYWKYISCYMKAGDVEGCLTSTGIDKNKLAGCISTESRGLAYAKEDFDLTAQYSISGSPTMILGGDQISESGFGGRTADAAKSIVCCAFNSQPDFCSQTLSQDAAATSFSENYSSGSGAPNSGAGCGT
ncbi:MAG: hypothetical protein WC845_02380 [Candidatus Staskawiczbacteria bacterium]|jgi:hypothetical protein